jgi:hypothetical protein
MKDGENISEIVNDPLSEIINECNEKNRKSGEDELGVLAKEQRKGMANDFKARYTGWNNSGEEPSRDFQN